MTNFGEKASLIWSIADLLRGSWKQHEYQDVILPLVVLKRLDDVLKDTKQDVLVKYNSFQGQVDVDPILKKASKVGFYNISEYDFDKLLDAPNDTAKNLRHYINSFSKNVEEIIEKFDFEKQLSRLEGGNLLYLILKELNQVDLHPNRMSNLEMGYVFEELIRKFSEMSNETAGEHYTPREVIQMMVEILFSPDQDKLKKEHIIKTVYDCCCGTGGMLTVSKDHILNTINKKASIYLYGQELNPTTYAICNADMLIKGEDPDKIKGGEKDHSLASTLSNDQFESNSFDYLLTNPPFGYEWKKDKEAVEREAERGYAGRFGAGLPRISDGQMLFLEHMISKMKNPLDGGSRLAIVFNGSPLFTGSAGSGESEIRRFILENDLLEAIIALPDQLFYNTGISTYVWFLSNNKTKERIDKVQLVDARTLFKKMRKALGNKRNEISDADKKKIKEIYENFQENEYCKIFPTQTFGYRQITIERPLRLNFQVNPERIEKLKLESGFVNLVEGKKKAEQIEAGTKQQQEILDVLNTFDGKLYKNREEFLTVFENNFKKLKLPTPLKKSIINALSERDETADICADSKDNPEADSELRDTENVPLGQDIYEYFDREVKPFVADAWIDETKKDHKDKQVGIVGYEIPLTRHFYKYEPPRKLEEIEGEIEEVENELLTLLKSL
ncbi:MAG TPA: restriction endonuclease subunit M [Candidatus Magasanikbacteria bacterium]|nr:restriction endonuclease subunit M [Candidatus Magasanikbacteria bacterium]